MTTKTIPGSDFFKSLGRLEALARGGAAEEQPGDMNKAQLFHTGSNSEQTSWPGGQKSEIGNKWDDSIGADGTDYHPARKAIAEKALKGIPLSPEEIAIIKSDIELSMKDKDDDDKDDKKDKDDDKERFGGSKMAFKAHNDEKPAAEESDKAIPEPMPMGKSFEDVMKGSDTLQKGIELSGFLADFAKAFGTGLQNLDARTSSMIEQSTNAMLQQLGGYLDERFAEQAAFNKSLAEAVVSIGHGVAGTIEQTNQMAQAPAGAPKSHLRAVQPVQKSFAGDQQGNQMSKSQKLDVMVDLVEKGQLNSLEVCKFETTGQLRPEVDALITQHIQSGGSK